MRELKSLQSDADGMKKEKKTVKGWVPTAGLDLMNKLITREEDEDSAKEEAIIFWYRSRDF